MLLIINPRTAFASCTTSLLAAWPKTDPPEKEKELFTLISSNIKVTIRSRSFILSVIVLRKFMVEEVCHEAPFRTLKNLFSIEEGKLLRMAPKLCRSALCPTSFQKQRVSLVLAVFNDFNLKAALEYHHEHPSIKDGWKGVHLFISIVLRWWTILNVASTSFGEIPDWRFNFIFHCSAVL